MPISRSEFEQGSPDSVHALLDFLRSNEDTAYTGKELLQELQSQFGLTLEEQVLKDILSQLELQGRIEAKQLRDEVYYIYRRPTMGFRR